MIIVNLRYPTPEEISALERAARRERAKAVARLLRAAIRGLVELTARGAALFTGKKRGSSLPAHRAV